MKVALTVGLLIASCLDLGHAAEAQKPTVSKEAESGLATKPTSVQPVESDRGIDLIPRSGASIPLTLPAPKDRRRSDSLQR